MHEIKLLFYFSGYLPLNKFLCPIPVHTKLRSDSLVVVVGVGGWGGDLPSVLMAIFLASSIYLPVTTSVMLVARSIRLFTFSTSQEL